MDTNCFDERFLLCIITGRHSFYTNLSLPRGLVQPSTCSSATFFETSVLKKVRILYPFSPQNINLAADNTTRVQSKASRTT